jgi:hypothetical protein
MRVGLFVGLCTTSPFLFFGGVDFNVDDIVGRVTDPDRVRCVNVPFVPREAAFGVIGLLTTFRGATARNIGCVGFEYVVNRGMFVIGLKIGNIDFRVLTGEPALVEVTTVAA